MEKIPQTLCCHEEPSILGQFVYIILNTKIELINIYFDKKIRENIEANSFLSGRKYLHITCIYLTENTVYYKNETNIHQSCHTQARI